MLSSHPVSGVYYGMLWRANIGDARPPADGHSIYPTVLSGGHCGA